MKKLSKINESVKQSKKIEGIVNSINYIDSENLKKYLEVADIFISEDAKEIVKWLISNNNTYISDLSTDSDENAIVGFYNAGKSNIKDDKLSMLWDLIHNIVKSDRVLEIPTLQTKEDFDDIISKKLPADYIILGLGTEDGREEIPIRYRGLIEKIVSQWRGKSSFQYEDLKSFAYEGLMYAMQTYGKKGNKSKAEDETIVNKTFGQYAAYMIRFIILENIKNYSHMVRIPNSAQKREKQSKGFITRSNAVSGDKVVGHNDEGNKSLFDFIGYLDTSTQSLDNEDLDRLWKEVLAELDKQFNKTTLDIFYSFYGINGHKQLQNKELATKYKCGPSKITYYCHRVLEYIRKNKSIRDKFSEINDLMNECLLEREANDKDMEPYYISTNENNYVEE